MNMDNIYSVLPGEEGFDEEEDASPQETPPPSTRQGLPGERSPNLRVQPLLEGRVSETLSKTER